MRDKLIALGIITFLSGTALAGTSFLEDVTKSNLVSGEPVKSYSSSTLTNNGNDDFRNGMLNSAVESERTRAHSVKTAQTDSQVSGNIFKDELQIKDAETVGIATSSKAPQDEAQFARFTLIDEHYKRLSPVDDLTHSSEIDHSPSQSEILAD